MNNNVEEIGTTRSEVEEGLTITRIFDAPREMVWKAWTDPQLFMRWWGPRGFISPVCKIDLRVGGKYLYCARGSDGKEFWTTGIYREIAPPSLLVMTNSFADEKGDVVPSINYGMSAGIPLEMVVTVRLQEIENKTKTKLILTHSGISKMSAAERSDTELGWNQSLEKLAVALGNAKGNRRQSVTATLTESTRPRTVFLAEPGKQEVTITREFDSPRELVFKAYTDASLYVKWPGPRGYSTKLEKFEPKSGGSWRYVQKDPSGNKYAFHGVYHEVLPPERLIDTFEFEGLPERGHVSLETTRFEKLPDRRTRLIIHSVFQSVADRDGMVASGMEGGVNDSMERLAEVLGEIKKSGGKAK